MKYIAVFVLAFVFAAPAISFAQTADGAVVGSDGTVQEDAVFYGEPIPPIEEVFQLAEAVERFEDLMGVEMILRGSISGPCDKDCWMILADGDKSAKIVFIDPSLELPNGVIGKELEVFGTLEQEVPILSSEGNDGAIKQNGAKAKNTFRIMARSIRISN